MRGFALLTMVVLLGACAAPGPPAGPPPEPVDGPPVRRVDPDSVPQPEPRPEPRSRYGNPPSYQVFGQTYHVREASQGYVERGIASWYGTKFQGRRTSSGEPYDMFRYTAAHRTLPLPTFAEVTNLDNGRTVIVRINDRGPFARNRIIDLSYVAAQKLGFAEQGTARVEVRAIDPSPPAGPAGHEPDREAGRIFLQAGAFSQPDNAERLRQRLAGAGLGPVDVLIARLDARTFYRVRIGPLSSTDQANDLVERVRKLGLEAPRLVRD